MGTGSDDNLLTLRSRILRTGEYKLIERIGVGGMSEVWKAWDIAGQRLVAIKILGEKFAENGEDVRHFRVEEKMLEEIHHPGIVAAYDFDYGNGRWYMVMEYVDGYTFADLLRRKGAVPETDCLLICESVARALNHIWNDHGIVHCDIKPENIMINTEGVVKLMDLGVSHRFQALGDRVKPLDCVLGTPAYISPEQVYGDVELDCRTDIYSLGATLYHLSTGRTLFTGLDTDAMMCAQCDESKQAEDPRMENPWLSEGFVQMLEAMLVKDRDYRVASWSYVYEMCMDVEKKMRFKPRTDGAVSSIRLLEG